MFNNNTFVHGPVADSVPYDPDKDPACELTSLTVQDALDELCNKSQIAASPGFAFGREGVHNNNTWLIAEETFSNKRGLPFGLTDGFITKITVSTENIPASFDVQIWYHNGNLSGSTLLTTVTTTGISSTEDFIVSVPVPQNVQLAVRLTSVGNPKPAQTGVFLVVKGNI